METRVSEVYETPSVEELEWGAELGCRCSCSGGAGAGSGSGKIT